MRRAAGSLAVAHGGGAGATSSPATAGTGGRRGPRGRPPETRGTAARGGPTPFLFDLG